MAGDSGSTCESSVKEVAGRFGPGLVGLHMKGTLTEESFAISRN